MSSARIATALWIFSFLLCSVGRAQNEVPDDLKLEKALFERCKLLLDELREQGVHTVGVLKFEVVRANQQEVPQSLGMLNSQLALKTELGLVWANPANSPRLIGVVRDASATAAEIVAASIHSIEGRKQLFNREYPLYWLCDGRPTAVPDAFVTGRVEISRDLRSAQIQFLRISTDGSIGTINDPFVAPLGLEDQIAAGNGLMTQLNSNEGSSNATPLSVVPPNASVEQHPLVAAARPIDVQIEYGLKNNRTQKITWEKQKIHFVEESDHTIGAYVSEPQADRLVRIWIMRRREFMPRRMGVLLRVNGVNTLLKQRLSDSESMIWDLPAARNDMAIEGYQISLGQNGQRELFKVFTGKKAAELSSYFGPETGLISVTLFEEASQDTSDTELPVRHEIQSIQRMVQPGKPAKSRAEFGQEQVREQEDGKWINRSVIGSDQDNPELWVLKTNPFQRASKPFYSVSIRYSRN